jgi:membrane-associated HD superfamily phosphohydrolase
MELEQRINSATPEQLRESLHQIARDVDDLDHMLYIGIENSYAARGISEVIYKINETIDDKLPKTEVNEPEQIVELEQRINSATPEQLRESLHQIARDVDDFEHKLSLGIDDDDFAAGMKGAIGDINKTIDDKLPKTEVNESEQLVRQLMNQNRTSDFKKESNETVIAGIRIPNEELFEITPPVTHLDDGPAWPPPPEQSR